MAKLISIFWRDIPAQVICRVGRENIKRELSPRFAKAIDRAAMRAGRGSSDAYLADWRRESEEVDGDSEQILGERVALLEGRFTDEYLERVVKAGGLESAVESRSAPASADVATKPETGPSE